MKRAEKVQLWVVYKMNLHKHPEARNAVCEQEEWDAMEAARPGYHTLIQAGIANEGEAERLARGTSGDPISRTGAKGKAQAPHDGMPATGAKSSPGAGRLS